MAPVPGHHASGSSGAALFEAPPKPYSPFTALINSVAR
jgi:hypothetical protein